jgi:hypothetical protein
MSAIQAALKQDRISCLFMGDYENYNAGESAVFNAPVAHMLKRRGAVQFNDHEVKNHTGLLKLLEGKNQGGGMNESDVARLVESKIADVLEKKLDAIIAKQLEAVLAAKAEPGVDSLPKGAIRK